MMKRISLLLLALVLAGCAPRVETSSSVMATTSVRSASFYPYEVGLSWIYHPEGESQQSLPYLIQTLGPTIFRGQTVYASQLTGRGAEQTWYRTYDKGVQLWGFTKPGVAVTLDPPWREAPAPEEWRLGLHWEGMSAVTVVDDAGKTQAKGTLNYRYDVQDYREVTLPAGKFNVWVVTRQVKDDLGGLFPAVQQYWFSPYVGDIRTPENLLMTNKNFTQGMP